MDRGVEPTGRAERGLTRGRELRRFNNCELGKPAPAPIT
jgi:hypothetical protein